MGISAYDADDAELLFEFSSGSSCNVYAIGDRRRERRLREKKTDRLYRVPRSQIWAPISEAYSDVRIDVDNMRIIPTNRFSTTLTTPTLRVHTLDLRGPVGVGVVLLLSRVLSGAQYKQP
jgi:hypothetical protein